VASLVSSSCVPVRAAASATCLPVALNASDIMRPGRRVSFMTEHVPYESRPNTATCALCFGFRLLINPQWHSTLHHSSTRVSRFLTPEVAERNVCVLVGGM
jgi:hypothetical protein